MIDASSGSGPGVSAAASSAGRPRDIRTLIGRVIPHEAFRNPPPIVGVVRLAGTIAPAGGRPLRRGQLNLGAVAGRLEQAFRLPRLKTVALVINSPGGAAVQAALIARRVRALAEEHEVPVVAFAEDVAASGGYWLACAGDEIFADASSVVGSIGVISGGFGLHEFIKRYGIERRLHTAGEHKAMLDPFLPEKRDDVKRLGALQGDVHEAFKTWVRERRGDRLKAAEETLFTGEFWSGAKALELGLIDGLGDVRGVMRERFGEKVKLVLFAEPRGWARRRVGVESEGAPWPEARAGTLAEALIGAVEDRLTWGRFGL